MRRVSSAVLALALIVPAFACSGNEEEGPASGSVGTMPPASGGDSAAAGTLPAGVTPQMVEQGQQLYGIVCVSCHGKEGVGAQLGPALDDAEWIGIGGELDQIANVIRSGVLQPRQYPSPMPPMDPDDFTNDEVRALAAYAYTLSHRS